MGLFYSLDMRLMRGVTAHACRDVGPGERLCFGQLVKQVWASRLPVAQLGEEEKVSPGCVSLEFVPLSPETPDGRFGCM